MRDDGIEGRGDNSRYPLDKMIRQPPPVTTSSQTFMEAEQGGEGLHNFWEIFRRKKGLILGSAVLGALIGFLITLPKPILYRADAKAEVPLTGGMDKLSAAFDPQSGAYAPTDSNIRTQLEILRSSTVKREVAARLEREIVPSLPPVPTGGVYTLRNFVNTRVFRETPQDPVEAMRQAIGMAGGTLEANNVMGTRIVMLQCTSSHPEIAAAYLNTLVHEFVEQTLSARMKGIQRTTQWMNTQSQELKTKLEKSEEAFQRYVRANGGGVMGGIMGPAEQNILAQNKLLQLEREASLLQTDRAAKQAAMETVQSTSLEALVLTAEGATLRDPLTRLQALRSQLAEQSAVLTREHYKIKTLNAQIAEGEGNLERDKQLLVSRLRRDYEDALRREKAQAAIQAREAKTMGVRTDKAVEYDVLKRQVENDRQLYFAMQQNLNQAGLATALPSENLRMIEPAQSDLQPDNIRRWTLNIGLGFVGGLTLAALLAVIQFKTSGRLKQPGDVLAQLRVPELGVIPSLASMDRRTGLQRMISASRGSKAEIVVPVGMVELATWQQKPSFLAESFRNTLASLAGPMAANSRSKIFVITSPAPREGKSTVACNLAIALTEAKLRVLLIDADLRLPRLHSVFNIERSPGLTDLVMNHTPISDYTPEELGFPTDIPGLYLLPAGSTAVNTTSVFYAPRFRELLGRLRREFDHILIDTPPILAFADGRIAAGLADGTILVVRSGDTGRADGVTACQRLQEDGVYILGAILNDWDERDGPGGKYQYYEKYYKTS